MGKDSAARIELGWSFHQMGINSIKLINQLNWLILNKKANIFIDYYKLFVLL